MSNSNIALAKEYHEATKHSQVSVREARYLNFENKPLPYKVYVKLTPIELPRNFPHPTQNAVDSVTSDDADGGMIDVGALAEFLYFSAGITKRIKSYDFRAAACTGALYEVEIYVVCGDIPGLGSGVYHFNPQDFALRQLRAGDFRRFLYKAAGEQEQILSAPVTIVLSAIYWRNSWKYQARAYRHFFWDSGTILANLLATSVSAKLKPEVILGFVDESVNHLLGLDVDEETTIALVPLGAQTGAADSSPTLPEPIPRISHEYLPLSEERLEYPEILKMHFSSVLRTSQEVRGWRAHQAPKLKSRDGGSLYSLELLESPEKNSLGRTIIRRGSTRQFAREPIPFGYLSRILQTSTGGIPADFLGPMGSTLLEIYLIVNAIDGLPAGAYYYDQPGRALEVLKLGNFREVAGYLCLEQALGADGSAALFIMSSLDSILDVYGNRGYRAAQLEGGVLLGKVYLCAYALEIGASGITFYDDAVTDFFSPHAAGMSTMVAAILGVPAYGKKPKFQTK